MTKEKSKEEIIQELQSLEALLSPAEKMELLRELSAILDEANSTLEDMHTELNEGIDTEKADQLEQKIANGE